MSDYKYVTIKQIADDDKYPFTLAQLRYWILKKEKNGLDRAIRKIGKRLYFRSDFFDEWIEKHNGSENKVNNE